eukprot:CAMPEP_0204504992 /NCGR_PEP_ID=MMETSP0471-20130131/106620_1 /ASSEMBLY_ACC=CAM_ASM_000602 /TAXON_ID=2969 /ORGANISM="Oxyrrhis marina" /LENGTH=145 /DNA_ID=CAMNT_0051509911 /DNA_START=114 /DNA_END=551 /DNA_ORIENTATION=-
MDDLVGVAILQGKQHLQRHLLSVLFGVLLPSAKAVIELLPGAVFHDQVQGGPVLVNVHQAADVRVVQLEIDFRLILHHLHTGRLGPFLIEGLQCEFFLGLLVADAANNPTESTAQGPSRQLKISLQRSLYVAVTRCNVVRSGIIE